MFFYGPQLAYRSTKAAVCYRASGSKLQFQQLNIEQEQAELAPNATLLFSMLHDEFTRLPMTLLYIYIQYDGNNQYVANGSSLESFDWTCQFRIPVPSSSSLPSSPLPSPQTFWSRLVRYYRIAGFRAEREVGEELSSLKDRLLWGAEGTLMTAAAEGFMTKWTPLMLNTTKKLASESSPAEEK